MNAIDIIVIYKSTVFRGRNFNVRGKSATKTFYERAEILSWMEIEAKGETKFRRRSILPPINFAVSIDEKKYYFLRSFEVNLSSVLCSDNIYILYT